MLLFKRTIGSVYTTFLQKVSALETHIHRSRTSQTLQIIRSTRNPSALSFVTSCWTLVWESHHRNARLSLRWAIGRLALAGVGRGATHAVRPVRRGGAARCRAVAPPSRANPNAARAAPNKSDDDSMELSWLETHLCMKFLLVFTRDFVRGRDLTDARYARVGA